MDKKLTDSEIVKALECCLETSGVNCGKCPYCDNCVTDENTSLMMTDVLDLINRQKAEIERLTSGKCVYLSDDETTEYCVEGPCPNYKTVAQIKAEAYKEFVNKIKVHAYYIDFPKEHRVVDEDDIDNSLKELAGDSNAKEKQ